jgi:hypothetical protein
MRSRWAYFAAAAWCGSSHAASFGQTFLIGETDFASCRDVVLMSAPIAVSSASRILASATVSLGVGVADVYAAVAPPSGSGFYGVTVNATRDEENASTLSTTGVVHNGSTPLDVTAAPLLLQPGTYQLQLHITGSNGCQNTQYGVLWGSLTYVLLGASFDQVFANGFA